MKKHLSLALAVVAMLLPQRSFCQISLDQCIRMAYENYPQIEEYNLIEAARKYDLSGASAAWAPQLSISGKATWQSTVVEMPFEMPGFEFNIPHDQYGLTADLTQQIWDGGANAAKKKLIDAGADVKKTQLDVNMYSIRSRVQNVYLGIILIDKQMDLNELLRSSLKRSLAEAEALVKAGVAYETDKDQISVSILSCDQQKAALETDRKAYVRMLELLTGNDLEGVDLQEPQFRPDRQFLSEGTRPEIALYDAQLKQASLQKAQLKTALSPKLNFNVQAGYGRPGLNMLSGEFDPYLLTGLRLQWNFNALYTLKNDRKKIDADAARIDLARKSFLLNTSIEETQKRSEIDKAADILARDEEIISLRKNIRETAERQYKEGVLKMNDYLSMLDEEFKARLNQSLHTVQYIMAVCDLQNTIGTENR